MLVPLKTGCILFSFPVFYGPHHPKTCLGLCFVLSIEMWIWKQNMRTTFLHFWIQENEFSCIFFKNSTQVGPPPNVFFFSFMIQIADISLPDFIFPLYPTLSHYIRPKPIKQTFNCLRFSVSFGWWFLNASCWFWIIARLLFLCMLAEELFLVVMGLRLGYDFMILVEYFSWLEQSR